MGKVLSNNNNKKLKNIKLKRNFKLRFKLLIFHRFTSWVPGMAVIRRTLCTTEMNSDSWPLTVPSAFHIHITYMYIIRLLFANSSNALCLWPNSPCKIWINDGAKHAYGDQLHLTWLISAGFPSYFDLEIVNATQHMCRYWSYFSSSVFECVRIELLSGVPFAKCGVYILVVGSLKIIAGND